MMIGSSNPLACESHNVCFEDENALSATAQPLRYNELQGAWGDAGSFADESWSDEESVIGSLIDEASSDKDSHP